MAACPFEWKNKYLMLQWNVFLSCLFLKRLSTKLIMIDMCIYSGESMHHYFQAIAFPFNNKRQVWDYWCSETFLLQVWAWYACILRMWLWWRWKGKEWTRCHTKEVEDFTCKAQMSYSSNFMHPDSYFFNRHRTWKVNL